MDPELSIYDWAFVNAGGRLVVRAALASLLESGHVKSSDGHKVYAVSAARAIEHPVEAEVLVASRRRPHRETLITEVSRGPAVQAIGAELAERRYVLTNLARLAAITCQILLAGLFLGLGLTSASLLIEERIVLVVLAIVICLNSARRWRSSSVATRSGQRALRVRQALARAGQNPPLSAADTVALFGAAALWARHRRVARELGVPFKQWSNTDAAYTPGRCGHISHGYGHAWVGSFDQGNAAWEQVFSGGLPGDGFSLGGHGGGHGSGHIGGH